MHAEALPGPAVQQVHGAVLPGSRIIQLRSTEVNSAQKYGSQPHSEKLWRAALTLKKLGTTALEGN